MDLAQVVAAADPYDAPATASVTLLGHTARSAQLPPSANEAYRQPQVESAPRFVPCATLGPYPAPRWFQELPDSRKDPDHAGP